jgi:hypothetical protein
MDIAIALQELESKVNNAQIDMEGVLDYFKLVEEAFEPIEEAVERVASASGTSMSDKQFRLKKYHESLTKLVTAITDTLTTLEMYSDEFGTYMHNSQYDLDLIHRSSDVRDRFTMLTADVSIHYRKAIAFIKLSIVPDYSTNSTIMNYVGEIIEDHRHVRTFLEHFKQAPIKAFDKIDDILMDEFKH